MEKIEKKITMKKQLVIIGIIALLVSVGLSGCNQVSNSLNPQSKFLGTWKSDLHQTTLYGNYTDTYIFFSDGTLAFSMYGQGSFTGDWQIKDGKLFLTIMIPAYYDFSFTNNDRTLTLTPISSGPSWNIYKQ